MCSALGPLAKGIEQELKSGPCPTCPVEGPSLGLCTAQGRGRCLLKSTLKCCGGSRSSRWWDRERATHCPCQRLLTPGRVSSPCPEAWTPMCRALFPALLQLRASSLPFCYISTCNGRGGTGCHCFSAECFRATKLQSTNSTVILWTSEIA